LEVNPEHYDSYLDVLHLNPENDDFYLKTPNLHNPETKNSYPNRGQGWARKMQHLTQNLDPEQGDNYLNPTQP